MITDGTYTRRLWNELEAKAKTAKQKENLDWTPEKFNQTLSERLLMFLHEHSMGESIKSATALSYAIMAGSDDHGLGLQRKNIENLVLRDGVPTRTSMYKICAALGFSYEITSEAFQKVFLTRPFNIKNSVELIYFYFGTRKDSEGTDWFFNASEFIRNIQGSLLEEKKVHDPKPLYTDDFYDLLSGLDEVKDERQLITYLQKYSERFSDGVFNENSFVTARANIFIYTKRAWPFASVSEAYKSWEDHGDAMLRPFSADSLLSAITDYYPRGKDSKNKLNLPKDVKRNMPTGQFIGFVKNGKLDVLTPDKLAKLLKLLVFYCFFSEKILEECSGQEQKQIRNIFSLIPETGDGLKLTDKQLNAIGALFGEKEADPVIQHTLNLNEFRCQLDDVLQQSGFVGCYPGNPFDLLLLHCASQRNPLATFRNIIRKAVVPI